MKASYEPGKTLAPEGDGNRDFAMGGSKLTSFPGRFVAASAVVTLLGINPGFAPFALGQSPAAATAPSLEQAETLATRGEVKNAIIVYEQLTDPSQPAFIRRGALGALLRLDPAGAEERIRKTLRGPDATLRPVAIAQIADLPAPDTSKKFGQELSRLQPDEQIWLIQALAGRGDADARAAIRAAVGSPDGSVRLAAIGAVGDLDDSGSVPLLVSALARSKVATEQRKLEFALASLKGGAETDQAILAGLKSSNPESKRVLISALVRRQSRGVVAALLEAAGDSDPVVVPAAFEALGKLASAEDLPALLKKLVELQVPEARSDAEGAVIEALTRIDNPSQSTEAIWVRLLRTTESEGRCSLLRLLPACAEAQGLVALKAARQDSDPAIRETAVRALAEWPNTAACNVLKEIYQQPASESHRVLALRALVRLISDDNAHPDAALIGRYRELLDGARTDGDRKLILGALAGAAHPDALPLALALLTNAEVRSEAALAVKKIAEAIKDKYPQAAQAALESLKVDTHRARP